MQCSHCLQPAHFQCAEPPHGIACGRLLCGEKVCFIGDWLLHGWDHVLGPNLVEVRTKVVGYLNRYESDHSTIMGISILEQHCKWLLQRPVDVIFSNCNEWNAEKTAKANHERIIICRDIRTPEFQLQAPSFHVPPASGANHYCAVLLHEWGHILHKNNVLDGLGVPKDWYPQKSEDERVADYWAFKFLGG